MVCHPPGELQRLSLHKDPPMRNILWTLLAMCCVLGSLSFVGAQEKKGPLKVCLVSGALEYDSDTSLSGLQKYLEKHFNIQCSRAFRKADNDVPGLDNLDSCDVMVLFTRRLTIGGEQL